MHQPCSCGSGREYQHCCGPYHAGDRQPETAEQLMRSRYCAFVRGETDYLRATWHPDTCPETLSLEGNPAWSRLEIMTRKRGTALDESGEVEFRAYFDAPGEVGCLHENSRFVKVEGRWLYVDGQSKPPGVIAPGRNAACPCGSGKKYKRCCGR